MRDKFTIALLMFSLLVAGNIADAEIQLYDNGNLPSVETNLDAINTKNLYFSDSDIYLNQAETIKAQQEKRKAKAQQKPQKPEYNNFFNQSAPVASPPASNTKPVVSNHPDSSTTPTTMDNVGSSVTASTIPVAIGSTPAAPANASTTPAAGVPGPPAPPPPFKSSGFVEAGGDYSHLSNGFGHWAGEYLKGEITTDPQDRWRGELLHQQEFGDSGDYLAIGNIHDFNEKWYSDITVGAADHGFFLPKYRIDAFLNRKWFADNSLITTVGLGEYKAQETYRDDSVFLGATYYFPKYWIVQGGVRYNDSNPGSVSSVSEFIALTEGEQHKHFITARYGYGKEAYEIISADQSLNEFYSHIFSLELRQWIAYDWGFDVKGEYYHNPYYDRTGMNIGVFHEF